MPHTISDKELGEIDKLPTKAAACELALDLNANIELLEFRTEVAARAEKLEYCAGRSWLSAAAALCRIAILAAVRHYVNSSTAASMGRRTRKRSNCR